VRVQVANGVVTYSRNGVTLYTSARKARYPLRVDASLARRTDDFGWIWRELGLEGEERA
jgi:hypothetical protein